MTRCQRDEAIVVTGESVANATAVATFNASGAGSALAPAAVTTSTIAKWLKIMDNGTEYFIPMWT